MTRDLINASCAALPWAMVSDPWGGGHEAWKVGGKMFAMVGAMDDGVSVKCADVETAALLIDMHRAVRAVFSWVMGHGSWVPRGMVSDEEMRERLKIFYRIIRPGLRSDTPA